MLSLVITGFSVLGPIRGNPSIYILRFRALHNWGPSMAHGCVALYTD